MGAKRARERPAFRLMFAHQATIAALRAGDHERPQRAWGLLVDSGSHLAAWSRGARDARWAPGSTRSASA